MGSRLLRNKYTLVLLILILSLFKLLSIRREYPARSEQLIITPVTQRYNETDSLRLRKLCDQYSEGVNIHNYHLLSEQQCSSLANSCGIPSCSAAIDIVVLWVNGSDDKFRYSYYSAMTRLRKASGYVAHSVNPSRFREFGQLKYMLRSIEKYGLAWARRIFVVTDDQIPYYLNVNHLRVRMVNHEQLFRYSKSTPPLYPLFNSLAIQTMIHTIPTLSSPFYLFDDDMLIRKHVPTSLLIDQHKCLIDLDANSKIDIRQRPKAMFFQHVQNSITLALRKRSLTIFESKGRYLIPVHGPILLYREIGSEIYDSFREQIHSMLSHPFRTANDLHIPLLYVYMGSTDYYTFKTTRSVLRFDMLEVTIPLLLEKTISTALSNEKVYFVCINDDLPRFDPKMEIYIRKAYEAAFPNSSSFENRLPDSRS